MAVVDIEKEIRVALLGMSAVTALVADRIWPDYFHSTTLPSIVIEVDNENRENDIAEGKGGLVFADVNLICRGATRLASRTLSEAVRTNNTDPGTGLAGHTGTFDAVLDDIVISNTPKSEGSNDYWYDSNMSFTVSWSEVR